MGVGAVGLSLTWGNLRTSNNGTDKSAVAPVITEVGGAGNGGGWYRFELVQGEGAWNVSEEDLVGVIDGGVTLSDVDRYTSVLLTERGLQLNNIPTILTGVESILDGQASSTVIYPSRFVEVRGFDSSTGLRRS